MFVNPWPAKFQYKQGIFQFGQDHVSFITAVIKQEVA